MGRLILLSFLAVAAHKKTKKPAAAEPPGVDLTGWADTHPEAAQSLSQWVQDNAGSAKVFFAWDESQRKTPKAKAFIVWALTQRGETVNQFSAAHPDWKDFARLVDSESVGLDRLVRWCAEHPTAAEELEPATAPFAWLGKHLYSAQLKAAP